MVVNCRCISKNDILTSDRTQHKAIEVRGTTKFSIKTRLENIEIFFSVFPSTRLDKNQKTTLRIYLKKLPRLHAQ